MIFIFSVDLPTDNETLYNHVLDFLLAVNRREVVNKDPILRTHLLI